MLNLEQAQMFVVAAETGSFSACARRLGKVQSAVSNGISALETDLGIELFDRSSRKPTLTAAGERLLISTRALLAQSNEIEKIAAALYRQEESALTIAVDDGTLLPEMHRLLLSLSERFPHLQLDLLTMASTDVIQEVAAGSVDIGLMFSEIESLKQVDFCFVGQIEFVPVCHPDFALSKRIIESTSALIPYRELSIRGRWKTESQQLVSICPNLWWCSSYQQIIKLLQHNVGWAYLPRFIAQPLLDAQALTRMNVAFDHKTWLVPVDLVFPKGQPHGPAFKWIVNEIKTIFA